MLLSVIIVNYNVKYFLEQCLCSVKKALHLSPLLQAGGAEAFVVDNNSADGSLEYLRSRFPFVQFISNKENVGFGKANNQALVQASGKYVLFLNPDTILPEDIFQKTISFMEARAQAGALGVRMVDGSGQFLKESKRGLPTAWASFCKMSGLTGLFPRSRAFAGYYQGHLHEHSTQEVSVLSGAFLLARRDVLNKIGGFDEQFFMYAEDIDLSYRVLKAGYKNYYFADATIIHFKGESTRKDARYVKLFYKAMHQFVRKHGLPFAGLLNAAIRLRSGVAMLGGVRSKGEREAISEVKIMGDTDSAIRLRELLSRSTVSINENCDNVVFCEGKGFAFAQVIAAVQNARFGRKMVCAEGSSSIVGSDDKNNQGTVIALE